MKSLARGKNISRVEIQSVTASGVWLFVHNKEYFLPYNNYPWFREATIDEIYHVKMENPYHMYWPDLDVDLEIESLEYPERYPLSYKK